MEIHVILVRIALGLVLGAAVGIERQWRARMAGLRTNALVSLGATLFVIMGAYGFQGPDADPTRVAAQIVSGIGFLGAGVIMKQGASVTGLNTAATLWATAAVGALAGGGMYLGRGVRGRRNHVGEHAVEAVGSDDGSPACPNRTRRTARGLHLRGDLSRRRRSSHQRSYRAVHFEARVSAPVSAVLRHPGQRPRAGGGRTGCRGA